MTKPDYFLCWNPNYPSAGVMADVARLMGIRVGGIEWGFFPDTFLLDRTGTLASSEVMSRPLVYPDAQFCLAEGEKIYKKFSNDTVSRYKQESKSLPEELKVDLPGRTIVLVAGINDLQSGAIPVEHPDRRGLLPFHESAYHQALAFAKADSSFMVIFKPHPAQNIYAADEQILPNFWVLNINPDQLIKRADVVVSSGSKMEFSALFKHKPLVTVGAGFLYKKGCSYEIDKPEQMVSKVKEAKSKGFTQTQFVEFKKVLGYFQSFYLYKYDADMDNEATLERFLTGIIS